MEICSSCFRCCLIPHNQNWELSVGVAGTKFRNPLKGRRGDSRRASLQTATLSNLSFARMCDNDLRLQVNVSAGKANCLLQALYLRDPDGNMLEFLSMLPNSPQPELGIVGWSRWNQIHESVQVGWG